MLTVLMTTYNETQGMLQKSIESILKQTFHEFHFLIVIDNPNNKDNINLIQEYAKRDSRISIVINEKNLGLPGALNRGIELINTKYIARMDADDIAVNTRLEKQLEFLEENNDVVLVGTNITYMNEKEEILFDRGGVPSSHEVISKVMCCMNVFNHPTFMGKTSVFKEMKYRNLIYSQDYDLTCRIIEKGYQVANLSESLLWYRQNSQISDNKRVRQKITMCTIQKLYKKKVLNITNIEELLEKKLKRINVSKYIKALEIYDVALLEAKNRNYKKAFWGLIKSGFSSTHIIKELGNLVKYTYYKVLYKF